MQREYGKGENKAANILQLITKPKKLILNFIVIYLVSQKLIFAKA
jgi:hypothetical protein